MKACLLVKTEAGKHFPAAKAISELEGVSLAFPSMGRTDVVAKVEVTDLRALTELIIRVGGIPGVLATETLIGMEA